MHQLDVQMRSKAEARLKTIKFFKVTLRLGCVAAGIVATVYSAKWVYNRAFFENEEFALTDLRIESDGELGYRRILAEGGIEEGPNLLTIDIEGLRERLERLPQVKKVVVTRRLPNMLSIRVEERFPVAWLSCPSMGIRSRTSQRGFMMDAEGVVIPCEALLRKYLSLPVIRAHSLPRVKGGSPIESKGVEAALGLIARSNDLFYDQQLEILEVDIRSGYSLKAFYNNDVEVTFGIEDIEDQLNDLKLILAHAGAKNRQVATLNLMPRKNIPVTYFNFPAKGIKVLPQGVPPVPALRSPQGTIETDEAKRRLDAIRAILGRG